MLQGLISITASRTKRMVANLNRKINDHCLTRVDQTWVKLKVIDIYNQNPKFDAINIAHMWGVGIECAKKTSMATSKIPFCM